jgi:hypothetical protein
MVGLSMEDAGMVSSSRLPNGLRLLRAGRHKQMDLLRPWPPQPTASSDVRRAFHREVGTLAPRRNPPDGSMVRPSLGSCPCCTGGPPSVGDTSVNARAVNVNVPGYARPPMVTCPPDRVQSYVSLTSSEALSAGPIVSVASVTV